MNLDIISNMSHFSNMNEINLTNPTQKKKGNKISKITLGDQIFFDKEHNLNKKRFDNNQFIKD